MRKLINLIAIICFCWIGVSLAADPAPLALMKKVTNNILTQLQKNKSQLHNKILVRKIVKRTVVPYFDLKGVARSVVGRNYWYQSSNSQRSQFISVFTNYVIDMYSSAIAAYSDETIVFKPMRNYNPAAKRVRIYSNIKRPGAPLLALNYRLILKGNSWKIYDFSVDGISMIQSYRSQFAPILRKGGMTQLISQLQKRG